MAAWETIVIGAGAAGLIAAERSAAIGRRTLLLEKARKPGVKILMSGGTRCNVTHSTDARGIVTAFGPAGRFLHSALSYLDPPAVVELFAAEGVPTKRESTGKIFPCSDRAIDVRDALVRRLQRAGAELRPGCAVRDVLQLVDDSWLIDSEDREFTAKNLIVTSGGRSYPGCGTTGDGYGWMTRLGHTIVEPVPALVPLRVELAWLKELQGVTFEDVVLRIDDPAARRRSQSQLVSRSSLLITHFGLSGPAAMNVSKAVSRSPGAKGVVRCDWFPDLTDEMLLSQFREAALQEPRKSLVNALRRWLVSRFAEVLVHQLGLDAERRLAEVPLAWWRKLVDALKRTELPVTGTLGFEKAEVTAGGVALDEVDSRTMASRKCAGLFLAGEILDLDGPIGGFNFQSAFATGWLAGYQGTPPQTYAESLSAGNRGNVG